MLEVLKWDGNLLSPSLAAAAAGPVTVPPKLTGLSATGPVSAATCKYANCNYVLTADSPVNSRFGINSPKWCDLPALRSSVGSVFGARRAHS